MQLRATEGCLRVWRRRRRCPTGSAILFALTLPSFCIAQTPPPVADGGDTQARLEKAITLEDKGDDRAARNGEAMAVNNLGVAELNRGDYAAARIHFEQALAIYRAINRREGEIEQLNNIGSTYYLQGNYMDAFDQYVGAMDRVEREADKVWSKRRRQLTTTNLAVLYQRLGQDEKALELYRQVQQSPRALTPSEEAQLYTNLGAMYRRLGDPVKAL